MRKKAFYISTLFLITFSVFSSNTQKPKVNEFDNMIKSVDEAYSKISKYTCTLYKKELIDGKLLIENNITYKHFKPDFYYLKWNEGDKEGTEALYAGKKYNYKVLAHKGGLLKIITVKVDPTGSTAMKGNRHSILESDIGFIIKFVKNNYYKAKSNKDSEFFYLGENVLCGRKVKVYKAIFPDKKGYYGHITELYIDKELNLPIKVEVFDWNNVLFESYLMASLNINPNIGDYDFDKDNINYGF